MRKSPSNLHLERDPRAEAPKKLGPAFSLFVWLIDRTTKEHEGVGAVLGGKPVKAEEIGISMGVCEKTILRRLDRLHRHGYIERTLTPHGYIIKVRKSCKFQKRSLEVGQKCPTTQETGRTKVSDLVGQDCPTCPDKSVRPNQSKQLEKALEQAVRLPLAPFWQEMGIATEGLSGGVRKLCEGLYAAKGNQSPVEFLSTCMDAIQAMGWGIPPQIAQAKAELKVNGNGHHQRAPMRELEAEPWGAGSGVRQ